MARVKNINGTSDRDCACGSWLKHWENFSGDKAYYCSELNCFDKDLVGAHVQKANSNDDYWYIVPLCRLHNAHRGELDVNQQLVSANRSKTCEK